MNYPKRLERNLLLQIFASLHRIDVLVEVALKQVKGIAREVLLRHSTDSIVRVDESPIFYKRGMHLPLKKERV